MALQGLEIFAQPLQGRRRRAPRVRRQKLALAPRDRRTSGNTVYRFKGDTPSPWVEVSNGLGAGLTLALPRPSFTLKSGLLTC